MRVYRFEHFMSGEGPYRGSFPWGPTGSVSERPLPEEEDWYFDGTREYRNWWDAQEAVFGQDQSFRFGFTSVQQLTRWFSREARKELYHYGLTVRRYETQRYVAMPHQIAFL